METESDENSGKIKCRGCGVEMCVGADFLHTKITGHKQYVSCF